MSLTLRDPEQREVIDEILSSLAPANAMRLEYRVGGYGLTDLAACAQRQGSSRADTGWISSASLP